MTRGPLIGVVNYGAGNIGSILNMLNHIGARAIVVADPAQLRDVDKVVLPGVGHYDHGVRNLKSSGMFDLLATWDGTAKPLMGICLGMQLLMSGSDEGEEAGLSLIPGRCVRFTPSSFEIKVPHMGWNTVEATTSDSVLARQPEESRYYFVHSYYAMPSDQRNCSGLTSYDGQFCSAIDSGTGILGYQFHPEKSHRFGMAIFRDFAEKSSSC